MSNNFFWEKWNNKSELEKSGIESLKGVKNMVFKEIPKEEVMSIYVKGSFIRREMNKKSDLDIVLILKKSIFLKRIKKLNAKYSDKFKPALQFSGYSVWELKNNKRTGKDNENKAGPSRAVRHIDNYELIYGKRLDKNDFYCGPDKGHLKRMVYAFNNIFIPDYQKGNFGFSQLVKQVFWLVENEQIWKGKNPSYSWSELERSIKDRNHIIHDTLNLRLNPTKDERKRNDYLNKLKKYISQLEKLLV